MSGTERRSGRQGRWLPRVLRRAVGGCAAAILAYGGGPTEVGAQDLRAKSETEASDAVSTAEVTVLLLDAAREGWGARTRGQLGDMDARIDEAAFTSVGSIAAQSEVARKLAAQREADLVAWLDLEPAPEQGTAPAEPHVRIWMSAAEELHSRRLGGAWRELSRADRSAALEVAAVTVRTLVRAASFSLAQSSLDVEAEAMADVAAPRGSDAAPRQASLGGYAGLGLEWQLDGEAARGALAPVIRGGLSHGRWSFGLRGSLGLPVTIDLPGAELDIRRHTASVEVQREVSSSPELSLSPLFRAGVLLTRRATRATSEDVIGTRPHTQSSLALGAGGRAVVPLSASHALTLELALTWRLVTPSYVLDDAAGERPREYAPWHVLPSLALGWELLP